MRVKLPTVFWGNKRVSHAGIMSGQQQATMERMREEAVVLLVQDTTSFNFSHHPAADGMGALENKYCRGFLAHTTLAVSAEGVPLGVLAQQVWARQDAEAGKSRQRHERPFEAKESYKWVTGLPADEKGAARRCQITVCDAEAHIYEFLDAAQQAGTDFIVRAAQGRSFTLEGQAVFAAVAQAPVQQRYPLALKRHPERAARTAAVELRFGAFTLKRPQRAETERTSLTLSVVDVVEPNPPVGAEAVHWLLLTSLPVETLQQAQQVVTFYTFRWLVERFHFVLKSGCKLEESQLRHEQRLERLLAVFSLIAWQLLRLTYQARQTPDVPCTCLLPTSHWQALYAFIHRTQRLPVAPPTLHQAVRWIGQLGGFLGRKGDGEPGVNVLWRGWTRLQDIVETWIISHPPSPKDVGNA